MKLLKYSMFSFEIEKKIKIKLGLFGFASLYIKECKKKFKAGRILSFS